MTQRLATPVAWGWVTVAFIDVAIAWAYIVADQPRTLIAGTITALLAVTSLAAAAALTARPTLGTLALVGAWGVARVALMVAGFAAVIAR